MVEAYPSYEEISQQIADLDWDQAKRYLNNLPRDVIEGFTQYSLKKFSRFVEGEDKKCRKEHGVSLNNLLDVEHPSD